MSEVTLEQMLKARENRVMMQQYILNKYPYSLVCFTMNIAGPIKTSPLIERAFNEGIVQLKEKLPKESILYHYINILPTGCEAMFSVDMDSDLLKEICTSIEDSSSLGRLFDLDVLSKEGIKLERTILRTCFVCGKAGRECAAGRLHSVSELQSVTNKIIREYFLSIDGKKIASLARKSLLDEVHTTPKPGLVDCRNNGSHTDMDINTFIASANAIKYYFHKCFDIGHITSHMMPHETFDFLRQEGIKAEKTMYSATGGINTHKGIIYSMGVVCGSIGRLWTPEKPFSTLEKIFSECSKLVEKAVESDFSFIDSSTAGGRFYIKYGLKGIRGEVALGFPSVKKIGLPIYKNSLNSGLSKNDAGVITLLHLIANVKDTNLYQRGDLDGALYAIDSVRNLLQNYALPTNDQIEKLDDDFTKRNLSPGGCADLLAITYFLHSLGL